MENLPTFKTCPSPSGGKVMCLWQKHSWGQKERSSGTQRLPLRGKQRSGRRWKLQWRPLQGRTRYWSCLFVIKPLRHGFLWLKSHHIHQSSCYNFQQALAQAILDGAGISLPGGIKGRLFWGLFETFSPGVLWWAFHPPGSLVECYDELGTRYSIPVYCLSLPINLVVEGAGDR